MFLFGGVPFVFVLVDFQKKEAEEGEKPEAVRTHLRDMIIVPEMIGSVIGVYNGKTFNQIEIKVCCCPSFHFEIVDLVHNRTLAVAS